MLDASGQPLEVDSIMTAVAKDVSGRGREHTYTDRVIVPPGETAVFSYIRDRAKIKGAYAGHKLVARSRVTTAPPRLALAGARVEKTEKGWSVKGTFKNDGPKGCHTPQIVVGLYTAEGKLRQVRTENVEPWTAKTLPAGQSAPVDVRIASLFSDGPVTSAKAWADCRWED
jgi:hypothetical protein